MKIANILPILLLILFVCFPTSTLQAMSPSFSEGLCAWQHSGKWGFIDTSGKPAIPFIWDDIYDDFRHGVVIVQKKGKWGMINKKCEVIVPLTWAEIVPAFNDYSGKDPGLFMVSDGAKWGMIDKRGKIIVEPVWDEISAFQGGVCPVRKGGKDSMEISRLGKARKVEDYGLWGFIDTSGRVIEQPGRWREVGVDENIDGRWLVVESGGSIRNPVNKALRYEDGRMVIDDSYDKKREEDRRVKTKLEEMGFKVSWDFRGLRSFKKEGKVGVVDSGGKVIVPAEWDEVHLPAEDGLIGVSRGGKIGFYGTDGRLVIPAEWEAPDGGQIWFNGEYAIVKKDGKVGVIDKKGAIVIPVEWDEMMFSDSSDLHFAIVCRDGKWGMIDRTNRLVVKAVWDNCHPQFTDGLLRVTRNEKTGFINTSRELVIPLGGIELGDFLIHEREWRDIKGRKILAPVLRIEEKNVIFFINGKEVSFSLDKLCDEDRALLRLAL